MQFGYIFVASDTMGVEELNRRLGVNSSEYLSDSWQLICTAGRNDLDILLVELFDQLEKLRPRLSVLLAETDAYADIRVVRYLDGDEERLPDVVSERFELTRADEAAGVGFGITSENIQLLAGLGMGIDVDEYE